MKVKILVPIRYPVGGIRTYVKYVYGNLDTEQYSFCFVAPSTNWLQRIRKDLRNHDVTLINCQEKRAGLELFSSLISLLKRKKFDIIHSQGYTASLISALANIAFRIPHIATIHHVFGEHQYSDKFWDNFPKIKRRLITLLLGKIDIINSVSFDAQNNLLRFFPGIKHRTQLEVIRNGIDISKFGRDHSQEKVELAREEGVFYLGYFGRYMPEKGFSYLIESASLLVNKYMWRDFVIISVGGYGGFIREYKKRIAELGLEPFFRFVDFVEDIGHILRQVDAIIVPSLGEACPLVPMEGLVCGTPIIAFRCVGIREVIKNSPAILVRTGDSNAMAREIMKLREQYETIAQNFKNYVSEAKRRYDAKNTAERLAGLFTRLLEK